MRTHCRGTDACALVSCSPWPGTASGLKSHGRGETDCAAALAWIRGLVMTWKMAKDEVRMPSAVEGSQEPTFDAVVPRRIPFALESESSRLRAALAHRILYVV